MLRSEASRFCLAVAVWALAFGAAVLAHETKTPVGGLPQLAAALLIVLAGAASGFMPSRTATLPGLVLLGTLTLMGLLALGNLMGPVLGIISIVSGAAAWLVLVARNVMS